MSLCSQSSTIQIHEKNIVEIAKNVIKMPGWKCEWGSSSTVSDSDCRVVLVSWNAYLQVSYLFSPSVPQYLAYQDNLHCILVKKIIDHIF
jgi:hypothetical protein